MNERIKELAEQATVSKPYYPPGNDGHPEYKTYVDHEKFAELIVGECLSMCADSDGALRRIQDNERAPDSIPVLHGAADYEYAAAYGKQIDHYESIAREVTSAGDKIREYFGVEE
jgi:hypothetical protein